MQRVLWMKWRYASWEMIYFTAFSFGCTATFFQTSIRATCLTSFQSRPRSSRAFRLSSTIIDRQEPLLSTNHRRDGRFRKLIIFVCSLAPKYILLLLTHFRKTNSMAIVTTGACAVVAKTISDWPIKTCPSHANNFANQKKKKCEHTLILFWQVICVHNYLIRPETVKKKVYLDIKSRNHATMTFCLIVWNCCEVFWKLFLRRIYLIF